MGGHGSGRQGGWRFQQESTLRLDIRWCVRKFDGRDLCSLVWSRGGIRESDISASISTAERRIVLAFNANGSPVKQWINLEPTCPNYGGQRWWALCPRCGRRVAVLWYRSQFVCRHCAGLSYESQRMGATATITTRIRALEAKIVVRDNGRYSRPKGMHRRTFYGIVAKIERLDDALCLGAWKQLGITKQG